MLKYVWVGNGSKKMKYDLESLMSNMKTGGQGDVYFPNKEICIKVLHNPDNSPLQLTTISKILDHAAKPYDQVRSVSAVPLEIVWDETGKQMVGYSMEQLSNWNSLTEILTQADSDSLDMDLRTSGLLLAELCKAIRLLHSHSFVIGDLNPSNVFFKREKGKILVKVIDVDSWSVYRKNDLGIEYASKVLDTGVIYYKDVIEADRAEPKKPWPNFTQIHDWWAFAYISWMVLTKYDPFMKGKVPDVDREDRILAGYTANSAFAVKLQPKSGPAAQALGPKLRFHLDRCLKHKVQRPFPTKVLEDFANNLRSCKKCKFTAHTSAIFCPKCAHLL